MTNQSQGRKKSLFPAATTIPTTATLDYVDNGTNYKISVGNFLAALGVTGTIVQEGAVTGTPVLDAQGTVNAIRNLESGSGVIAEVSPDNGITIEHNFDFDDTGTALTPDATAQQVVMRSLGAGSGMSIAVVDDRVVFTATGITVASNVVIVNTMADFPAPIVGVITLAANTGYLISAFLTTADRFVLGSKSVIFGSDRFVGGITYTGTGDMFTAVDVSVHVKDITINATTGRVFNCSSTIAGDLFLFDNCTVPSCDKLGLLTGMTGMRFSNLTFQDMKTDGIEFTGTNGVILASGVLATVNGGAFGNLGTATFESISCISCFSTLAGGTFFLDGTTASGNISSGNLGAVTNSRFFGAGTPLNNISVDDARWQFAENNGIPDTRPDGLLSMQANGTATINPGAGSAALVAGTWVIEDTSQFTGSTAGRLTFDAERDAMLPVTSSVTVSPVSGGTVTMSAQIAIDGVPVAGSKRTAAASSSGASSITMPWQTNFSNATYVEIWITNESSGVNLLVSSAVHRVN